MTGLEAQQGQGQSDFVIEISGGRQGPVLPGYNGSRKLPGGGFSMMKTAVKPRR